MSVADAILHKALLRKNLHVIVNTLPAKLLLNKSYSKALGVEVFIRDEKDLIVNSAENEIIVKRSYYTPLILLLSGMVPQKLLKNNVIKISKKFYEVLENL